jgi:hypothetical protein
MLDKIRRLLGVKEIPDEVTPLYRGARSEREALALLREARRRDEQRRRRAMQDLEVFGSQEEELLEEGKGEVSESRRLMLARRIKEIRTKVDELNGRIENIYNKRITIFNEHIGSLETVLELTTEELPDKKSMEEMAIRARELLENLEKSKELAQGIAQTAEPTQPDEEEKGILREMERRADLEIEKAELGKLEAEKPAPEKPRKETPAPERKSQERPEIEFED